LLAKVRDLVTPSLTRYGPIKVWIIDDTSFPKKGRHSVGVHHQYCGQLGKQANCQVVVTLSIANHHGSLPIAYQLYLPRAWTDDKSRRAKTHVPRSIRFKTKPQIALEQIRAAVVAKVASGIVLMDASYGTNGGLRRAIAGLGLRYVAAIVSTVKVRPVGELSMSDKLDPTDAFALAPRCNRSIKPHAGFTKDDRPCMPIIGGIASLCHQHAVNPGHVVARIECVQRAADIGFKRPSKVAWAIRYIRDKLLPKGQ
jgi:hypothetical protein